MAVVVGTAVAYLTLDTTAYAEAISAAGDMMRQFVLSSEAMGESIQALGTGAREAGAEVKARAAEIAGDYRKLSDSFRAGQAEDSAFFLAELAARALAADESAGVMRGRYDKDAEDFRAAEALKTGNLMTELRRQEREVRLSQEANAATLREFVPAWHAAGLEFGNMLLAGIQSTRDQITAYLADISGAVAAATAGQGFYIGAYAGGTEHALPGLAIVGEEGPEIVDFSGGEQVLSFQQSMGLLGDTLSAISEAASGLTSVDWDFMYGSAGSRGFSGKSEKIDYKKLAEEIAGAVRPSLTYSPTYNSPVEMSVAEMRRLDRVSAERMGFAL